MSRSREARPDPSARPRRSDYVAWRTATTRWADDDVYGHMNNAALLRAHRHRGQRPPRRGTGVDIRSLPAIGVVAEVSCRYFAEMRLPPAGRHRSGRRQGRHLLGGLPHRAVPGRR